MRLQVFHAVAHSLNIGTAAKELLLSRRAVTRQIQALEVELSTRLFDRFSGRLRLTHAGEVLLTFAEQMDKVTEQAREAIAESRLQDRLAGRVVHETRKAQATPQIASLMPIHPPLRI